MTIKLGVISDTHIQAFSELPTELVHTLSQVDLIVHAGDFTGKPVLDGLRALGEVKAVCGNMDGGELRRVLPQKDLFTVGRKKVGLVHGWGPPRGLGERVRQLFPDADIVIYGHSHQADSRRIEGTLVFNPGQARDSFGLLNINEEIIAEIIPLHKPRTPGSQPQHD